MIFSNTLRMSLISSHWLLLPLEIYSYSYVLFTPQAISASRLFHDFLTVSFSNAEVRCSIFHLFYRFLLAVALRLIYRSANNSGASLLNDENIIFLFVLYREHLNI